MTDAGGDDLAGPWDVAILGGGSAGCVLAARLSEDAARRVLLVEAGPDLVPGEEPAEILSPYPGLAYFNPAWTWGGLRARLGAGGGERPRGANAEGEAAAPVEARPYEQARILGGGSSINGIGANRGAPSDYDGWAALGAEGWSWREVLPVFRALEADADFGGDAAWHGADGPVPIRRVGEEGGTAFSRALAAEFERRGFPRRPDQNGRWEDGVFPIAVNTDAAGRRASFAACYLTREVRARANLRIATRTRALRLRFEGARAAAAALRGPDGVEREVAARLFVVCAGAIHSPALLLRSGVGPAKELRALGVPVAADVPGVGRGLQEHPSIGVSAYLRPGPARLPPGPRYHIPLVLRWSSGLEGEPPGDMHTAINLRSGWHAVGRRVGTVFSWVNRSHSRGAVRLRSPDPDDPPEVAFNLLSDERDLVRLAAAFRLAASALAAPGVAREALEVFPSTYSARVKRWLAPTRRNGALTALAAPLMDALPAFRSRALALAREGAPLAELLAPGPQGEAALRAHLRRHVGGVWHPSGTCRMGSEGDAASVCSPADGRVFGVAGLAVCDASLMPAIPCANLNIPVAMIAEKLAVALRRSGRW